MVYRRFRLSVTVQVALILLTCSAIAYLAATTAYYATILMLAALLGLQVAALLHYVQKTNRELARFLLAVRHADFSQSFSGRHTAGSFAELAAALEEIVQRFRETRTEKEEQASYLQTLVQHVPVPVVALNDAGGIELFNKAARRLFGVSELRSLRDFEGFGADFPDQVLDLEPGQQRLVKVTRENELLQLNVAATSLRIGGQTRQLVSLQDIHGELEARELEAWQNLIRVLTHEIMNSVTPISSLAATAGELLTEARQGASGNGPVADAQDAVDTIAKRSTGLLNFVESYRRLMRLPKPTLRLFPVGELFARIAQLMGPELERRNITLEQSISPRTVELSADPDLLEQVLINLIRNAIDAVTGVPEPQIRMSVEISPAGHVILCIADNGHGMDEQVQENIFVPFFTTKRHGTGVGMSLVRQIMRSHRGNIGVQSAPGEGTAVRLSF